MDMVKLILTDGTTREMTRDEFRTLSMDGMMEALDGKAIVDFKFYEESGV